MKANQLTNGLIDVFQLEGVVKIPQVITKPYVYGQESDQIIKLGISKKADLFQKSALCLSF